MLWKISENIQEDSEESSQRYRGKKYGYGYLFNWYIKWTIYKIKLFLRLQLFLNWNEKKETTGKTPFFPVDTCFTSYSICLNIGFWQDSFVWKCYAFDLSTFNSTPVLWKKVFVFRKVVSKLNYWRSSKFATTAAERHAYLLNEGLSWKTQAPVLRKTYVLSVSFKMKPLKKSIFLC